MRFANMNPRTFVCTFCNKSFMRNAYLREHEKTHTKQGLFVCAVDTCERHTRGFPSKGNLRKHERRHHDTFKYPCSFCESEFDSAHQLSYHLRRRKFRCIHCCHSNDIWGHLYNHCKTKHPDKKQIPKHYTPAFASCVQNTIRSSKRQAIRRSRMEQSSEDDDSGSDTQCFLQETPNVKDDPPLDNAAKLRPTRRGAGSLSLHQRDAKRQRLDAVSPTKDSSGTTNSTDKEDPLMQKSDNRKNRSSIAENISTSKQPQDGGSTRKSDHHPTNSPEDSQNTMFSLDQDNVNVHDGAEDAEDTNDKVTLENAANLEGLGVDGIAEEQEGNSIDLEKTGREDANLAETFVQPMTSRQLWVLRLWMLDHFQEQINQMQLHLCKEDLFEHLEANWNPENSDVLYATIATIDSTLSSFVAAVLLLDFLNKMDPSEALDLYTRPTHFSPNLSSLLEVFVQYKYQKKAFNDYPKIKFIQKLPSPIKEKIDLQFCANLVANLKGAEDGFYPVMTTTEVSLCFQITRLLVLMAESHVQSITPDNEGVEYYVRSSRYFNKFIHEFMKAIPTRPCNCFSIIQIVAQSERVVTTVYAIPTLEMGNIEIHLHAEKLEAFGVKDGDVSGNPPVLRKVTNQDVATFLQLLYNDSLNVESMVDKLTVGVCDIAEHVGIGDVWHFLFRNWYIYTMFLEADRASLLATLFRLNREKEIDELIRSFKESFKIPFIHPLTKHLSTKDICSFVQNKHLELDGLAMYKVLITWAYQKAGKNCVNPMNASRDEDVVPYFDLVKKLLPLSEMRNVLHQIKLQDYIRIADM